MEILKTILRESLTGDNGFYSAKKLQMFASFMICVLMAFVDMFTPYKVNMAIFGIFAGIAGLMPALGMAEKSIDKPQIPEQPKTTTMTIKEEIKSVAPSIGDVSNKDTVSDVNMPDELIN